MPIEVKIIANRLLGKAWSDSENQVAQYLNDGWKVIGFSTARDMEYGDIVYVMLQRDAPDPQSTARPEIQRPVTGD